MLFVAVEYKSGNSTRIMRSAQKMLSTLKDNKRADVTKRCIQRTLDNVCGSCGTPLSTQHHCCVVLITECHNSHKHSQSPLTTNDVE